MNPTNNLLEAPSFRVGSHQFTEKLYNYTLTILIHGSKKSKRKSG